MSATTSTGEREKLTFLFPMDAWEHPQSSTAAGFDAVPGLSFAFASTALLVPAVVHLNNGGDIQFTSKVPDVEAALILKALAWKSRNADKDAADNLDLAGDRPPTQKITDQVGIRMMPDSIARAKGETPPPHSIPSPTPSTVAANHEQPYRNPPD